MRTIFPLFLLAYLLVGNCLAQYQESTINGKTVYRTGNAKGQKSNIPLDCGCPSGHETPNGGCNPVDAISFTSIYRKDFSYLVAAVDNIALLNQLVVSVDKPSISYSQIFISKTKRQPVSGGLSGKAGLTDDIAQVFSQGKFDASFSFGPRLNIDLLTLLNPSYQYYYFERTELNKMACRIKSLDFDLQQREKSIRENLDSLINLKNSIPDSLTKTIPEEIIRARLTLAIDSLTLLNDATKLTKYNRDKLTELQTTMKWNAKRHFWLSIGPDFSRRTFNTFDLNDIANQQIVENNIWTSIIPISLNYYEVGRKSKPSYFSLSWTWERTNDILNEDYNRKYEKEIINYSDSLGNAPKVFYKNIEKKSFYTGNNQMVVNKKIAFQWIQFFNSKQTVGLIVNFTGIIPDSRATMNVTYVNPSLGVIVPAISGDGKSKLNIVANFGLNDLLGDVERWKAVRDETYTTKRWSERISFNLRVGLPISILANE